MYQLTTNYKTLTIKEKVIKKATEAFNLLRTASYLIVGYATYESENKIVATAGVIILMIAAYRIISKSFNE